MTKNFSTTKFALSKCYCRGASREKKNSVLDDFPLCPQSPSPLKTVNFIFIVVSPSLIKISIEIESFERDLGAR